MKTDPVGSDQRHREPTIGAQTLNRGLDIMERALRSPCSLPDLIEHTGFTRSTARRLIDALVSRGFLAIGSDGRVRGGRALIRLGTHVDTQDGLISRARPILRALSDKTGLSSFLGERDGDYSIHLHRAMGRERVMVVTPVGTRRHLAETSLGKALLFDDPSESWQDIVSSAAREFQDPDWVANMRLNVERGFVIHNSPARDGIRAVGAPVRNLDGNIIAAISIAAPMQYLDDMTSHALGRQLVEASNAMKLP